MGQSVLATVQNRAMTKNVATAKMGLGELRNLSIARVGQRRFITNTKRWGMGLRDMVDTLWPYATWIVDHWPGVLVPVVLLCGAAMVRTATVLARKRAL
jgi:hypothetical protein